MISPKMAIFPQSGGLGIDSGRGYGPYFSRTTIWGFAGLQPFALLELKMHKNAESTVEWKIAVKRSLAAQVEHRLIDPITLKPTYGLRSKLINSLLEEYLRNNPSSLDAPGLTEADIKAIAGENAGDAL